MKSKCYTHEISDEKEYIQFIHTKSPFGRTVYQRLHQSSTPARVNGMTQSGGFMNMHHLLWIPGLLAFCVLTASAQQETTEPEEALTPQQQAAVNSPEAKKVEKDLSQQVAAIEAKAAQQSRAITYQPTMLVHEA